MKMYCYTFCADKIMKEGYLSAAKNPAARDIETGIYRVYLSQAKETTQEAVTEYLESTYKGRTRSICCVTMPAPEKDYLHPYLNNIVKNADIISFDLDELINDGLVEAIYCKDDREYAHKNTKKDPEYRENIYKVSREEIDFSPIDWDDTANLVFSPYSQIKHYAIVLTKGYIPPEYITVYKHAKKSDE